MKQALIYSLKVWLTSVIVAPLLNVLIMKTLGFHVGEILSIKDGLSAWITTSIVAMSYSIPSWLLLWLSTYKVSKYETALVTKKFILSLVGVALTCVPVWILFFNVVAMTGYIVIWSTGYGLPIVAGIWYYKLKPEGKHNVHTNV